MKIYIPHVCGTVGGTRLYRINAYRYIVQAAKDGVGGCVSASSRFENDAARSLNATEPRPLSSVQKKKKRKKYKRNLGIAEAE